MKRPTHKPALAAILLGISLSLLSSCQKFTEIGPPVNQLTSENIFTNDATANSAIVGIYSRLSQSGLIQSVTPLTGMYSDELSNYTPSAQNEFTLSKLGRASSPTINSNFWNSAYQFIYPANAAIDQLEKSNGISAALKSSLTGEAKFIRAYLYLNLTCLFGEVPIITATGYTQNLSLPRSPRRAVMDLIITDLKEAAASLPEKIESEKIRANRWSALALLARVYLYDGQYEQAAQTASELIESKRFSLTADPGKAFLKNSSEAILQLYPTQTNQNTPDGVSFLPASATEVQKYYLTPSLLNSFEPGDLRKTSWVTSRLYLGQTYFYPCKYKVINNATLSEYLMILRLAEQYLIRAEARIRTGNIPGGAADLNILRRRSRPLATPMLPDPMADLDQNMEKPLALLMVEKERRIELMTEIGHRWFDLQRTGRAENILAALKPDTWLPTASLWPVPEEQLRLNPFLTQNPGYNK